MVPHLEEGEKGLGNPIVKQTGEPFRNPMVFLIQTNNEKEALT